MQTIIGYISMFADLTSVIAFIGVLWGLAASLWLWRSRWRRHHFSKVYFPKNPADFYDYYVDTVGKARESVRLTSDGFNQCSPTSSAAAERMNDAQRKAVANGATIMRYQMLTTMHINWLYQIVQMKRELGDAYRSLYNPAYEQVGSFAVIDGGTRHAIVEFMLPNTGGLTQATTARDFGFIHGHQAKADATVAFFRELEAHEATVEITEENYRQIAQRLFDERLRRHCRADSDFHLFDEEILIAQRNAGHFDISFESVRFRGWPAAG